MKITVTQPGQSESDNSHVDDSPPITSSLEAWIEDWIERCDVERRSRLSPLKAKREAATNEAQRLKAELAISQCDINLHTEQMKELAEQTGQLQASVDSELESLRAECVKRIENADYSEQAERLRRRRDGLAHDRAMVGALLQSHQRSYENTLSRLHAEVADVNRAIEAARLAATTDSDLLAQAQRAGQNLRTSEMDVIHLSESILGDLEDKVKHAQDAIEAEVVAQANRDEAESELDDVNGKAFAQGCEPDGRRIHELTKKIKAADEALDLAKKVAKKARSALPHLETEIEETLQKIERRKEQEQKRRNTANDASRKFAQRLIEKANKEHERTLANIASAQERHFEEWKLPESAEL